MDRIRRPSHRALAVALATLIVPLVVGSVAAAPPGNRPMVNVTAGTPTGGSVTITAAVNRGTGDLASCSYIISPSAATACQGTLTSDGKKASHYTFTVSNQTEGSHTITVTVRLKDGGSGSGSTSFTIAAPRVFAIAWSNRDNEIGYQAGNTDTSDVLIAKLVDTNRDNVVDRGDTVTSGRYPLTFAATTFGNFTATSHTVDAVPVGGPSTLQVTDGSGSTFTWAHSTQGPPDDLYFEGLGQGLVWLQDNADAPYDYMLVLTGSPSAPDTAVPAANDFANGAVDNTFLEVNLDLP